MEVTARGYGANADLDALRDLAILVGLRVTDCPACGGRGRSLYAREVEDGCDECECAGVVVIDPAEEVERLRAELAETERRLDAEISAMDARDGAYHALNGARDGSDELVALAECRMAEIKCLRAKLALERERCAGLVREIPACQPGAKATAARRWLDDRVAACVRAIEVDDEAATCARALVREARERAKAAEADVARLTRERDQMGAQQQRLMAMIGEQTAEVGRLHTDNASLDDVARAAIADIDAVRAELARVVAERDRLQRACDEGLPRERIDCPACGQMHVEVCAER
jgi:chromosome segregation ATPase